MVGAAQDRVTGPGSLEGGDAAQVSRAIVLGAGGGAISVGDGTTLTLSGAISGQGLAKQSAGTLVLQGVNSHASTTIGNGVLQIAANGNLGDVKSLGHGVSEMRIFVGQGYRLYFTLRGGELIVLLCGGDKSTQARDIKTAKSLASDL